MGVAVVGAIALVFGAAITGVFQFLNSRNDRTLAHQEVDLLAKLDPRSESAQKLNQIVTSRIDGWHSRAFTPTGARRALTISDVIQAVASIVMILAILFWLYKIITGQAL